MPWEVIRLLQDDYEYYRNRSKEDLLRELSRLTEQQKQRGELDENGMEEAYSLLAPLLDPAQRQTLRALIDGLK